MITEQHTSFEGVDISDLTSDQLSGFYAAISFLQDPTTRIFALQGFAGTGKTFLVNKVKEWINRNMSHWSIVVTAPSHKAKQNIMSATRLDGITVQKLNGFAPYAKVEDFDINNQEFRQVNQPQYHKYKVIIQDEFSMINEQLHKYTEEMAEVHGNKIIFVGDQLQLAPIGEIKPKSDFDNTAVLNQSVRQDSTNPLGLYIKAIRCDILHNEGKEYEDVFTEFLNDFELFRGEAAKRCDAPIDKQSFIDQAIQGRLFSYLCRSLPTFVIDGQGFDWKKDDLNWQLFVLKTIQSTDRYIPHRNKTVKHYNTVIRNKLMDHPDERLVIGDLLLSYSTIYSDENFNIVENSGSYIVKSIKPFKYEINNVEYFGQRIVVKEAEGYDGYHRELDVLDPKCYRQYLSLMQEVYEKCKKKRDYTELNNTKNKFAIMDSLYNLFKNDKDVQEHINMRIVPRVPTFDYAYAITAYKSQGSTYDIVFVDACDMKVVKHIPSTYNKTIEVQGTAVTEKVPLTPKQKHNQFLRLIYVAISRAKKIVHIKF
jgi:hypothetical protein